MLRALPYRSRQPSVVLTGRQQALSFIVTEAQTVEQTETQAMERAVAEAMNSEMEVTEQEAAEAVE